MYNPDIEDKMLRNRIVFSLKSRIFREKLIGERSELALQKCTDIVKIYELSHRSTLMWIWLWRSCRQLNLTHSRQNRSVNDVDMNMFIKVDVLLWDDYLICVRNLTVSQVCAKLGQSHTPLNMWKPKNITIRRNFEYGTIHMIWWRH